ncbi:KIN12E, partial [Symbiodinium pilosum]
MNELSSRSHSVFTLKVEASSTTAGGVTSTRVARLNLIDLAGSERQTFDPHHPSAHESIRVKEAGAINRSLSALTNVIMSLSRSRRKSSAGQRQPFVRYRDSKLTFLLRDSLGGNSKTVIVACISPSAMCFGETLSTLKFAARAKHIRCA